MMGKMRSTDLCTLILLVAGLPALAAAPGKPRARDLGVPLDGATGPWNAITDVNGVEVGHTTLIDRKSTRLNSSHTRLSRMPSSA